MSQRCPTCGQSVDDKVSIVAGLLANARLADLAQVLCTRYGEAGALAICDELTALYTKKNMHELWRRSLQLREVVLHSWQT